MYVPRRPRRAAAGRRDPFRSPAHASDAVRRDGPAGRAERPVLGGKMRGHAPSSAASTAEDTARASARGRGRYGTRISRARSSRPARGAQAGVDDKTGQALCADGACHELRVLGGLRAVGDARKVHIRAPIGEKRDGGRHPLALASSASSSAALSPEASGVPPPPGSCPRRRLVCTRDRVGGRRISAPSPRKATSAT
jgi:hypothetical protein